MCNYFSCLIDRNLKAGWDEATVQHETLIKKSGWKDDKLDNRDFVRIEITPKDPNSVTRNREDWNYKVDEEDTLPTWYEEYEAVCIEECWKAWEESVKINIVTGHEVVVTNTRYIRAHGSAQVEAHGSAQVKAHGSAQVEAYDSAQVIQKGSGEITLYSDTSVITDFYNDIIIVADGAKIKRVKKGV